MSFSDLLKERNIPTKKIQDNKTQQTKVSTPNVSTTKSTTGGFSRMLQSLDNNTPIQPKKEVQGFKLKDALKKLQPVDNFQQELQQLSVGQTYEKAEPELIRILKDTVSETSGIAKNLARGTGTGLLDSLNYISKLEALTPQAKIRTELENKLIGTQPSLKSFQSSNILNNLNTEKEKLKQDTLKEVQNMNNPVSEKLGELAPSIGQMLPSFAGGPLGLVYSGSSAAGSYYDDAKSRGIDENKALLQGGILGIAEGAVDKLQIGKLKGAGKSISSGKIVNAIKDFGINIGTNFIQEAVMEPITEATSGIIGGKDKANFENIQNRMLQSGIDGALTSILLAGGTAGISSAIRLNNKLSNKQNVTIPEIKKAVEDIKENSTVDIDKIADDSFKQVLNNNVPNYTNNIDKIEQGAFSKMLEDEGLKLSSKESKIKKTKSKKQETSKFADNVETTELLSDTAKELILNNKDITNYNVLTNKDVLENAKQRIDKDLSKEYTRFLESKDTSNVVEDQATGIILAQELDKTKQYDEMLKVIDKIRETGTKSGQAIQIMSVLQRLSPVGMVKYVSGEINNIQKELEKTKTKEWIKKNVGDIKLNPKEIETIIKKTNELKEVTTQREKQVLLAEINAIITDKIPPKIGDSINAFRRISMLLNPKTMIRNITSNLLISPLNLAADSSVGTVADKLLSKKTNIRTTAPIDIKEYGKGFKTGLKYAIEDYTKKINTKDINIDKFELGKLGKNFKNTTSFGRIMNEIDRFLGFALDVGDRPFFEAERRNSLVEQMKSNNIDMPTPKMYEIANQTALERTWQDNNTYTKFVLDNRNKINQIGGMKEKLGIGLGDLIIPFAKTPANLTKAIVDYSPVGIFKAISDYHKLDVAIQNKNFTPELQRKVVDDISKAFVGTLLYAVGGALAKAGLISGEDDEDYDLAKFKKDIQGIQPYSFKIGDKTFTYDWAQPIATPFAIMANLTNSEKNKGMSILNAISEGGNILYEQSFLQNVKKLFGSDGPVKGLIEVIASVPASFIPTALKQINDFIDPMQRNTYVKDNLGKTTINQILSKIPGASKTLPATIDVLGRKVEKYSGENNAFNILLNPANIKKENLTKGSSEILKLYESTGNKNIIPRIASNTFTYENKDYTLTPDEKTIWQKNIGSETDKITTQLSNSKDYKNLSNEDKSKIVEAIIRDLNDREKLNYLNTKGVEYKELSDSAKKVDKMLENGLSKSTYYIYKGTISNIEGDKIINKKGKEVTENGSTMAKKAIAIDKLNIPDEQKDKLLNISQSSEEPVTYKDIKDLNKDSYKTYFGLIEKQREDYKTFKKLGLPENGINKYYEKISEIEGEKNEDGKTISGTKKKAVAKYINSLPLSKNQKTVLFVNSGYDRKANQTLIYNMINNLKMSKSDKQYLFETLGY